MSYYFPEGLIVQQPTCRPVHQDALDVDACVFEISETLTQASPEEQLLVLTTLLQNHASDFYGILVPSDFIKLSLEAMLHLKEANRTNVVYNLVSAVGTKRPHSDDTRLPVNRMPMGLLEHCVSFFSSSNTTKVINIVLL